MEESGSPAEIPRKRMIAHPLSSQSPSSWEGLGVGSLLANAACNPQAGGDGSQYGCYGLNDEFPSFLLHNFEL